MIIVALMYLQVHLFYYTSARNFLRKQAIFLTVIIAVC